MVIGIDVRMWAESGIGRYVRNLVRELARIDSADRYVLFCLAKDHEEIFRAVGTSDRWRFVIADYLWYTFSEQLFLPFLLYRENLDLVHFPHFNIPILYFKPFAVTIHDLTHFTFAMKRASTRSGFVYGIKHAAYSFVFSQAVRRSRKIFAVSEYVKNALCERFTLSREKIVVTYESAETPVPISTTEAREFLAKKNIGSTYFFYVGNAHPHKNIEFLLEAFKEFRQTHQDVQLVLAGKENYFWKQLLESSRSRHLLSNVLYLGYVSDTELAILYSRAVSYVFPSLSEGFGLPLLEAMSYGCPVLSSKSTCLPEVGGDAALYFNPELPGTLVELMEKVMDESTREQLVQRGFERVGIYSWNKMAASTKFAYSS